MTGRVVVAGSVNADAVARVATLPQPGETVAAGELQFLPGGKGANQAVAAARAGVATALVACVGGDAFGHQARSFLTDAGVDCALVRTVPERGTGTALVVVDATGENTVVVAGGANACLTPEEVEPAARSMESGDVAVAQCEIPLETVHAFLTAAVGTGATTLLNAAPAIDGIGPLLDLVDVLVVNEIELAALTSVEPESVEPDSVDPATLDPAAAVRLVPRRGDQSVIVTLGRQGAVVLLGTAPGISGRDERVLSLAAPDVVATDTTGAGDCFTGSVAARLASGDGLEAAVCYSMVAAALCVQRPGAGPAMPTAAEVAEAADRPSPPRAEPV